MAEWFETKVKFLRQMDNGLIKSITEQYLVDSMSFTEAEGRVMTEAGEGMREVTVVSIKRSSIKETVLYGDSDLFFKVKVAYELMDEETEKAKKVNTYLLVNANDAKEAYERTQEHLKEMLVPLSIVSIAESPIIEVYQYQKGLRPGLRKVVATDGGNGTTIGGDGTILRVGGEFDMKHGEEEFDAEDWYEGLPEDMKQDLVTAFNKKEAETWLKTYDSALDDDCITDIIDWLEESAEHETVSDCAYTKQEQVGKRAKQKPDYPVWLANQIQEAFGWTLDVLQIRRIIEEYDKGRPSEFLSWFAYAHKPTDKQIQACLTALKQPRQ